MPIIDVHTHYVPDFVLDILSEGSGEHGIVGTLGYLETQAGRLPVHYPEMHSPNEKLIAMDARGVDVSLVSLTPHLFIYGPEHDPVGFARKANDALAAYTSASDRLFGIATLPLGNPPEAADELRRAVSVLGLVGGIIGTGLSAEQPLDAIGLDPVFEAAATLDVPLMLHPYYCGVITSSELFLNNTLGVPFDAAWAVARLIASGTLDRHPRLKLLVPHGGGALPYLFGRMENAWNRRSEVREAAQRPPSAYKNQFWYDSIVHSDEALRYLVTFAGADRVLLGTDSPYLTGDLSPSSSFAAAGLDPQTASASTAELFRLRLPLPDYLTQHSGTAKYAGASDQP
ncbi:amidohydrolase family protein [Arthrobacter sp. StoSoilB5]|uniref:amidohydrolase family protein n=1 Tax=Arthrobacter sp. StoSoilB5 TaxID=2830992 RepID=UPI001CC38C1C|nr:amidohydrolase family protein [Arthrobacter sp. StoSoilB5]BCW45357.1 amidohydrolase [Arthrobacter sp. StoSoilB5]